MVKVTKRSILVADDNGGIRRLLHALLEEEGYRVLLASSLSEAVEMLYESAVDLVLTDSFSRTPETAVGNIRLLLAAARKTPVALMTGHRLPPSEVRALRLCAVIAKPFDVDVLIENVRRCVRRRSPRPMPVTERRDLDPST